MRAACVYIECPITKMILAVSRKDDPNAFGLPGGKVEDGETEAQAAARELGEETGISLLDDWRDLEEVFRREGSVTFQARYGRIWQCWGTREKGNVAWVTPEQLMAGPFGDYNRRLLQVIGRIPPPAVCLTSTVANNKCKCQTNGLGFCMECGGW